MAGQYLVTRGGRDSFYTEQELRALADRGQLNRGDLVYHPILGRWLYAREVEEVREELAEAVRLGRPTPKRPAQVSNGEALAGFVLGLFGYLPLIGLVTCLFGIYFSGRGLRRAAETSGSGHGLAVAGLVLSVVFLLPAAACAAVIFAGLIGTD